MSNPIQLPAPNMGPGGFLPPGQPEPSAIAKFLQIFFDAQQNKRQNRNSDAAIEAQKTQTAIAQGHLKLAQEEQRTQQAKLAVDQANIDSRGRTSQAVIKALQPAIEQHAQSHPEVVEGLMGGQQGSPPGGGSPLAMGRVGQTPPQFPTGQPALPTPADPMPNWGELVQKMTPEAAAAFVEKDLPNLLKLQDKLSGGDHAQAIQTGDTVTTYVPGKGFYDASTGLPPSDSRAWKASIERHKPLEEIQLRKAELQLAYERLATQRDYRTAIRAQVQTRAFVGMTRKIRERGMFINQAILTISDAQNNPDPNARRVLTTSAIANFVQAADQNAQLRIQMLNYFKDNVDPSIAGKWSVLSTRLIQGTLPQYVTGGLLKHLNNLLIMSKSEYERQRTGEIKRHPELGNWLPEADEFFTADNPNATGQVSNELQPPP